MKAIILAGGLGTRLSEETASTPKPMVKIVDYPILLHIVNHFYNFGFREFIICLGYKQEVIKEYFMNMQFYSNNLLINQNSTSIIEPHKHNIFPNAEFKLIDTGLKSNTAERLLKAYSFINKENPFKDNFSEIIKDTKTLEIFKKDYLKFIKNFNYSEKYITDKAPLNFRWIGIINLIFPKSKIIH